MLFQTWFDYGSNKIHGHELSKNDGQFKNDSRSNKTAKIAKKIENVDFEY